MAEPDEITIGVSEVIGDITDTILSVISSVVDQIAFEIDNLLDVTTSNIGYILTVLVKDVTSWELDEWLSGAEIISVLQSYISIFAGNVSDTLGSIVEHVDLMLAAIAEKLRKDTDKIEAVISEHYQKRMFTIYGRIAEVSVAIDAPPAYLETMIQDAKTFAAMASAYAGLSWWNFQLAWDDGLQNLLKRITGSMSFYRVNPQRIKTDIEELMIKPLYEVMLSFTKNRSVRVSDMAGSVEKLKDDIAINRFSISENKYQAEQFATIAIAASQTEIMEFFDSWNKNTYRPRWDQVNQAFVNLFSDLLAHADWISDIFKKLALPGDLLEKINLLSPGIELQQAEKISEVASRVFRNEVDELVLYSKQKE